MQILSNFDSNHSYINPNLVILHTMPKSMESFLIKPRLAKVQKLTFISDLNLGLFFF